MDEHDIRRLSEYKREGKSNWRNQQSGKNQPPPPRQSPPNQCGGCGAQGERMHPRDQCPARGLTCYLCGKTGHYRSVCRSPQNPQNPPGRYSDAPRQPYYPPPASYPPPPPYTSLKTVCVNEVREGQADPTPMMRNITVTPHEGGHPFLFDVCPDTGCTKTIIARNLAIRQDMRFNPGSTLKIRVPKI